MIFSENSALVWLWSTKDGLMRVRGFVFLQQRTRRGNSAFRTLCGILKWTRGDVRHVLWAASNTCPSCWEAPSVLWNRAVVSSGFLAYVSPRDVYKKSHHIALNREQRKQSGSSFSPEKKTYLCESIISHHLYRRETESLSPWWHQSPTFSFL